MSPKAPKARLEVPLTRPIVSKVKLEESRTKSEVLQAASPAKPREQKIQLQRPAKEIPAVPLKMLKVDWRTQLLVRKKELKMPPKTQKKE